MVVQSFGFTHPGAVGQDGGGAVAKPIHAIVALNGNAESFRLEEGYTMEVQRVGGTRT